LWLLIIDDPVFVINNILVEMLGTTLQVNVDKPLVGEAIECHVVADVPLVHGAAKLHFLVSWTSVMKHEDLRLFRVFFLIEGAHDGVDLEITVWGYEGTERVFGGG
jgi:hypothetical protein